VRVWVHPVWMACPLSTAAMSCPVPAIILIPKCGASPMVCVCVQRGIALVRSFPWCSESGGKQRGGIRLPGSTGPWSAS
jgi:hypothetical protein